MTHRSCPWLLLPLLAGCAHAPPPVMDDAAVSAWTAALADYEQGRLAQAMARLRELERFPEPLLLRAVTENRPADALRAPPPRDEALLPYRAVAAWRVGDAADLRRTVDRMTALSASDADLAAMAVVATAAGDDGMRRLVADDAREASFDPALGLPLLAARLGGREGRVILDTGAEVTVVDVTAAASLGVRLPEGAGVTLDGNAGSSEGSLGLLGRLELMGRTWEVVPVVLADLSALPAELGVVAIVAVGDLLGDAVLTLDYVAGRASVSAASRAEGVPFYLVRGRTIAGVMGRVEGGPEGLFRIDTGGRRSVLTAEYVDAAVGAGARWVLSRPEEAEVRAVGVGRRSRRTVAEASLCLAGGGACVSLTGVPVDTTAADSLIRYAGKLGADAFAGRRLELDYPACRMRLGGATVPAPAGP